MTRRLRTSPPALHGEGTELWGLAWSALQWLEDNLRPGMATLEIGSGSSTLVFAASGAAHEAITPASGEEAAIRRACDTLGIDASHLTFHIGFSHEVLARWDARPLDLVLIDGAHGFPYPILDWWFLAPHIRVGGQVLLDDAYLPAVGAIVDFAKADSAWRLEDAVSFRTARLRKLSDEGPPFDADSRASHGRLRFAYLPPARRAAASVRQRLFSTRAGLWLLEQLRPPRPDRDSA